MRNREARLLRAVAYLLNRVAAGEVTSDAAAECIEHAFGGRTPPFILQDSDRMLSLSITELGPFTVRTRKLIRGKEIETIGELVALSPDEIMSWRNCGIRSLNEIRTALHNKGLKLRGD